MALEDSDLMFNSPHLIFLSCWTEAVVMEGTVRFPCVTPLFFIFDVNDFTDFCERGTDTVSIWFWVGNCPSGSAERRVRLQLCPLLSTLKCHGPLLNSAMFLEIRAAPSRVGCMPSLLIRPGFSPESLPIVNEAHIVNWTPPRQPAVKR